MLCGDDDEAEGAAPIVCKRFGCTAWLHERCRMLLRSRVLIYWDEDKEWYWGRAEPDPNAAGERLVHCLYVGISPFYGKM